MKCIVCATELSCSRMAVSANASYVHSLPLLGADPCTLELLLTVGWFSTVVAPSPEIVCACAVRFCQICGNFLSFPLHVQREFGGKQYIWFQ